MLTEKLNCVLKLDGGKIYLCFPVQSLLIFNIYKYIIVFAIWNIGIYDIVIVFPNGFVHYSNMKLQSYKRV